jgi:hypothetical protein
LSRWLLISVVKRHKCGAPSAVTEGLLRARVGSWHRGLTDGTLPRVIDEPTLAQMNGQYVLPPDAGPAWRSAHEAGVDMSLIEAALKLTPEERLAEHQSILDFLLEVQAAGELHAAK